MGWTIVVEYNGNIIGYKAGIASIEKVLGYYTIYAANIMENKI